MLYSGRFEKNYSEDFRATEVCDRSHEYIWVRFVGRCDRCSNSVLCVCVCVCVCVPVVMRFRCVKGFCLQLLL